jgi:hypothetical protein
MMRSYRLREMNVDTFGAEWKRAVGIITEVKKRLFGVVVAIHSCYNKELIIYLKMV